MDDLLTKSIAAAIGAVISAVASALFSPEKRPWTFMGAGRRKALTGKWSGALAQDTVGYAGPTEVTFELKARGKTVTGSGTICVKIDDEKIASEFSLRGGFLFENFLRLEYTNKDESVVQFGSCVLKLDTTGRKLTGQTVGYGWRTGAILTGELVVEKVSKM